ncbi:MAG: hypothetical protein KIT31_05250 [Deltaproteobacteria bacterium]|nr:hypothetical protein [Deltaproteobacteria bacterium]
MDYDVVFVGDERNAVRVSDHRRTPNSGSSGWSRPPSRTVVVPPGARPTVITGGASSAGYYRPQYIAASDPSSFASRFGMSMGELIDAGIQILAAIQSLPAAPTAQGDVPVDLENLLTYQSALWSHAKRDEQLRTLGGLLTRILR